MVWFDEVRPAFLVSQALGLLSYKFVAGIPVKSRPWQIYACIKVVGYLCDSFVQFAFSPVASNKWTSESKIITLIGALRTASTFAVYSLTVSCAFDKMKTLFDLIEKYDQTLKIDFTRKSRVVRTWMILFLPTIMFAFSQVRLLFNEPILDKMLIIYLLLRDMAWYVTMLKFVTLVNSIERRLKQLHSVITADTPKTIYYRNDCSRPLRLNDACRLHDILASAANILNSIYNMFLPIWIINAAANTTTRVHHAIDVYKWTASSEILWNCAWEIPNITVLLYLFTSCHNTNVAANKIGSTALSPRSWLLQERFLPARDEGFIIGQHFALQPFHFTSGYGLFVIELSFLGSVLGAIMTVLLILFA